MLGVQMWMLGKPRLWKFSSQFMLVWGIIPTQGPSCRHKRTQGFIQVLWKQATLQFAQQLLSSWRSIMDNFGLWNLSLVFHETPEISHAQKKQLPTTLLFSFSSFFSFFFSRGKVNYTPVYCHIKWPKLSATTIGEKIIQPECRGNSALEQNKRDLFHLPVGISSVPRSHLMLK